MVIASLAAGLALWASGRGHDGVQASSRSVEQRPKPAARAAALPATAVDHSAEKPLLDATLARKGQTLFEWVCARCHGPGGAGDGPSAEGLAKIPANLTRGVFKLRSTPKGLPPTDEDLFGTLSRGMGLGGLPSFGKLSASDRWALVAYVKTLSPAFETSVRQVDVLVTGEPPADWDAVRGQTLFASSGCTRCHGDSPAQPGSPVHDATGRPLHVTDFSLPEAYIGGSSPKQVYRTIMTGIDGTPMPQGMDIFGEAEAWDVVAYVISLQTKRP